MCIIYVCVTYVYIARYLFRQILTLALPAHWPMELNG